MTKFKVGDRVRTVNLGNGWNNSTPDGIEFDVTSVVNDYKHDHGTYYRGDPNGYGIWESRLELVKDAPEAETETTTTVNHYWRPAGYPDAGWGFCYNEDIEFYLSRGHDVKRVTKVHTKTTEYLEPEDD